MQPWINFNGNAEEAMTFYRSVLGGAFTKTVRFKDLAGPHFTPAKEDENKIMMLALASERYGTLRANDVPSFLGKVEERENRSKIHVAAPSREEAERIFTALSAGGEVEGPLGDSPWGTTAGMFRDRYGIEWIVEHAPR